MVLIISNWHRDWRDNIEGLDREQWWRRFHSDLFFNQINCALYPDDSLCASTPLPPNPCRLTSACLAFEGVVPGSHLRGDTPGEVARFPTRPVPLPELPELRGHHQLEERCKF